MPYQVLYELAKAEVRTLPGYFPFAAFPPEVWSLAVIH